MKVFFLGQGRIAEAVFKYCLSASQSNVTIVGASSNACTDVWWGTASILQLCNEAELAFVPNNSRNEDRLISAIVQTAPDWLFSIQHPWVLGPAVLDLVHGRAVNLHTAPLPEYGGFNGISHAILNGETQYGVTLHWMADKVDSGPHIIGRTFNIGGAVTALKLHQLTVDVGTVVAIELIDNKDFWQHSAVLSEPIEPARIYSRRMLDQHRLIRSLNDAGELKRKSLAFFLPPFEPAYAIVDGEKFYILPDTEDVNSWISSGCYDGAKPFSL